MKRIFHLLTFGLFKPKFTSFHTLNNIESFGIAKAKRTRKPMLVIRANGSKTQLDICKKYVAYLVYKSDVACINVSMTDINDIEFHLDILPNDVLVAIKATKDTLESEYGDAFTSQEYDSLFWFNKNGKTTIIKFAKDEDFTEKTV